MNRLLALTAVCLAAVGAVACGGDDDDAPARAAETSADADAARQPDQGSNGKRDAKTGITIETRDSQYGDVLFDDADQAIYLFGKESSATSECYGRCAEAWPPVATEGAPRAGGGVDASLLGTTKRDDGTTQVTYDGHPLYYYVDDPPGVVGCHNVEEFGGLWLAVDPSGAPVE
jgi:predicted lipoprotein with Yx(FWY)xxD motif